MSIYLHIIQDISTMTCLHAVALSLKGKPLSSSLGVDDIPGSVEPLLEELVKNPAMPYTASCGLLLCYLDPDFPDIGAVVLWPVKQHRKIAVVHQVHIATQQRIFIQTGLLPAVDTTDRHTQRAAAYLRKHSGNAVHLDDMQAALGLDKAYLCRKFKQNLGITMTKYLNGIRIARSFVLMEQSELSLIDISLAVGFSDQCYFCRVFRKLTKTTPCRWKKEQVNKAC